MNSFEQTITTGSNQPDSACLRARDNLWLSTAGQTDQLAKPQSASPAFESRLLGTCKLLEAQQAGLENSLGKEVNTQGMIGTAFDALKNHIGVSGTEAQKTTPAWLWAQLFDRSSGSQAVAEDLKDSSQKLSDLQQAAQDNDLVKFGGIYHELTGKDFDQNKTTVDPLKVAVSIENYHSSQENGVEFLTDIGSAAAAVGALRLGAGTRLTQTLALRLATGFAAGAASKCALKEVDGKYASLPSDLITGGINGLAFPQAERSGLNFSPVAMRHGIAVIAGTENATRTFVREIRDGKPVDGYQLLNDAFTGYALGYASSMAVLGGLQLSSTIRHTLAPAVLQDLPKS